MVLHVYRDAELHPAKLEQSLRGILSLDYNSLCSLRPLWLNQADGACLRNGQQQQGVRRTHRSAIDSPQHSPYQRREIRTHPFPCFKHLIMSESDR